MKSICSFLALTLLVAGNAFAQPPAPTVKITCAVNYDFVQNYARDTKSQPTIVSQGDNFSMSGLFVTRRSINLYPKKIASSNSYKVTLDARTHSFLSKACTEDIGQVLSYIDTHEFGAMQNVFYLGEESNLLPPRTIKRKVGDWNLASWNNRDDRGVGL